MKKNFLFIFLIILLFQACTVSCDKFIAVCLPAFKEKEK